MVVVHCLSVGTFLLQLSLYSCDGLRREPYSGLQNTLALQVTTLAREKTHSAAQPISRQLAAATWKQIIRLCLKIA